MKDLVNLKKEIARLRAKLEEMYIEQGGNDEVFKLSRKLDRLILRYIKRDG